MIDKEYAEGQQLSLDSTLGTTSSTALKDLELNFEERTKHGTEVFHQTHRLYLELCRRDVVNPYSILNYSTPSCSLR